MKRFDWKDFWNGVLDAMHGMTATRLCDREQVQIFGAMRPCGRGGGAL